MIRISQFIAPEQENCVTEEGTLAANGALKWGSGHGLPRRYSQHPNKSILTRAFVATFAASEPLIRVISGQRQLF